MAEYLCDLSDDTFVDRSGVDVANELTGPAGMQAAIRGTGLATALAAGDTLWLAGTGDLSRLIEIDCNGTDISNWGIGDTVQNDNLAGGVAGDDWTGVVVEPAVGAVTDIVLIWLDAALDETDVNTADGIENTVAGGGAGDPTNVGAFTSVDTRGIEHDNNEGSAAGGYLKIVGTANLSSPGSTAAQATLEALGFADNCLILPAARDYLWFQNLTLQNATGDGYSNISAGSDYHVFWSVYSNSNTGTGFNWNGVGGRYARVLLCHANDNGSHGFYRPGSLTRFAFCEAIDNVGLGFESIVSSVLYIGCLSHGNVNGFELSAASHTMIHCVVDGNDEDGIQNSAVNALILGCRITNNGTGAGHYGIDAFANIQPIENWNFFFGNTSNQDRNNIEAGPDSDSTHTDPDDGYVNAVGNDWNVKDTATLDSVAIEID